MGTDEAPSWVVIGAESPGYSLLFLEDDAGDANRFLFRISPDEEGAVQALAACELGGLRTDEGLVVVTACAADEDRVRRLGESLSAVPECTSGVLKFIEREGASSLDFRLAQLEQCRDCGEVRGRAVLGDDAEPDAELFGARLACRCQGVPCRYCELGTVRRPLTYSFDRETGIRHTPWFGYLLPCDDCQAAGRGPLVER